MKNNCREFDDLDWQAFRYIANEMTEAERTAFEARLGRDAQACEAVARLVDLSHAVARTAIDVVPVSAAFESHSAIPQAIVNRKPRWRRAVAWVSAIAAGLAVALLLHQSLSPSTDPSTLARLWAKVGFASDAFSHTETELLAGYDDGFMSAEEEAELSVPDWVIEAVGSGSDSDQREDS